MSFRICFKIILSIVSICSSAKASLNPNGCYDFLMNNQCESNNKYNQDELDLFADELEYLIINFHKFTDEEKKEYFSKIEKLLKILRENRYKDPELMLLAGELVCHICADEK